MDLFLDLVADALGGSAAKDTLDDYMRNFIPNLASGNNPERMFPATLLSALPVIPCAAPLSTSKAIYKYSYTVYL